MVKEVVAYGIALPDGSAAAVPLSGWGIGWWLTTPARRGGCSRSWSGSRRRRERMKASRRFLSPGGLQWRLLASSTSRGELGRRAELDRQPEWSGQDADLPIGQALSLAQQVPQDGDDWVPIDWRDLHGYAQHTSTVEEPWMGVAPELRPWLWSDDSRVR